MSDKAAAGDPGDPGVVDQEPPETVSVDDVRANKATTAMLLSLAVERAGFYRQQANRAVDPDAGGREFSEAITLMESASMWFTRGLAKLTMQYRPADLELVGTDYGKENE